MPEFASPPVLLIVFAVIGYLLGSIPSGVVIAKAMGLGATGRADCLRDLVGCRGSIAVFIAGSLVGRVLDADCGEFHRQSRSDAACDGDAGDYLHPAPGKLETAQSRD